MPLPPTAVVVTEVDDAIMTKEDKCSKPNNTNDDGKNKSIVVVLLLAAAVVLLFVFDVQESRIVLILLLCRSYGGMICTPKENGTVQVGDLSKPQTFIQSINKNDGHVSSNSIKFFQKDTVSHGENPGLCIPGCMTDGPHTHQAGQKRAALAKLWGVGDWA